MKKLFSTMLAATMVAGMAVTAFAEEPSSYTRSNFNDQDYGLVGAYKEINNKYQTIDSKTAIDGGDKLYFPILVSNEELELDENNANDNEMHYATKASEIDDLKASVKDEVGGKYIADASIVKKDIELTKSGTFKDSFANYTADTAALNAAISDVTVKTGSLTGGASEVLGGTATGVTATVKKDVAITNVKVVYAKAAAGAVSTGGVTAAYVGDTLTFTVTGTNDGSDNFGDFTANTADLNAAISDVTVKTGSLTGGNTDVAEADAAVTATVEKDVNVANVKVDYVKAASGSASTGGVTASYVEGTDTLTFTVTGANKGTGTSSIGKVYCVEVEMDDYFKNEETEVEFNITLKNNGRTEYESEDDAKGSLFCGEFDLGKDSEKFDMTSEAGKEQNGAKATKFKKGDLEIEIGEKTKSIQLDEVKTSDGDEDVDNIFIENDDTIDNAFTFDVKASGQDDLYLELNQDAVKDLAVSNQKADLTFFNFPGEPEFDFAGTATFAVEDEDEDNYFYEIVDGELVESNAKYDEDDGVFKLRTNKLGSYVLSDRELDTAKEEEKVDDTEDKGKEGTGGDATEAVTPGANGEKGNANTGAADLIGVASALAVVSVAAAGAVALKK